MMNAVYILLSIDLAISGSILIFAKIHFAEARFHKPFGRLYCRLVFARLFIKGARLAIIYDGASIDEA